MAKKRSKKRGKKRSKKVSYSGFGTIGRKKKRKGGPRGGAPAKAFAVARDSRGRLAGFKKLTVAEFKAV